MALCAEQQHAMDLAMAGHSIFLTGSAGVGKSYTLKRIIDALETMNGSDTVFATGSTGIAALAISGMTLHSFAGVGLGTESVNDLLSNMKFPARQRWKKCTVLVVDEISMVSAELFTKLDSIARGVRNNSAPFGGIQLVLCGDFFQLPPVGKEQEFTFQSPRWVDAVPHTINLTRVFRQSDEAFVSLLNALRWGQVPQDLHQRLAQCYTPPVADRIVPTRLYPRNMDVSRENHKHLSALTDDERVFTARDSGSATYLNTLKRNCNAEEMVKLRKGAQVILLKNMDVAGGLVNGSRGVVLEFDASGMPVVEFSNNNVVTISRDVWAIKENGVTKASRTQIPLALAWALTVHKSQGMSIDRVFVDLSRCFEYGQAYVALSRARSLEGLKLVRFPTGVIRAHPDVVKFYTSIAAPVAPASA